MDNRFKEIDTVIEEMQALVAALRVQNPDFYARYPMNLSTEAEEETIRFVTDQWQLPDEYLYFLKHYVPESVSWNTDEYLSLDIYGARELSKGQWGYQYNPVTDEAILDWPSSYLVIACDEGDPYCMDLSRGDTVIYTAEHGTGRWDFSIAYDDLVSFLRSTLLPRGLEEWEMDEDTPVNYYKLMLTGNGQDKIKTLMFIKKAFSCDYAQARAYLEQVPLLIYKGVELRAAGIEAQLKSIGADYDMQPISLEEFISDH